MAGKRCVLLLPLVLGLPGCRLSETLNEFWPLLEIGADVFDDETAHEKHGRAMDEAYDARTKRDPIPNY